MNVKSGDIDGYMLPIGKAAAGSEVKVTFELKGETEDGYVRLSAADFDQQAYSNLKKIAYFFNINKNLFFEHSSCL